MKAMVEPLPLVPATWITGGSCRSGWPSAAENAPHPIERKIDQLRMQRGEPRDDGVDRGHARYSSAWPTGLSTVGRAATGLDAEARIDDNPYPLHEARPAQDGTVRCDGIAGRAAPRPMELGDGSSRQCRRAASPAPWSTAGTDWRASAAIAWRCTTMSTMPWSLRYSARWKPSGSFSRMVCSITRGPAKPMSAPGSAMWTSPSIA